jgi:hypothetical protein
MNYAHGWPPERRHDRSGRRCGRHEQLEAQEKPAAVTAGQFDYPSCDEVNGMIPRNDANGQRGRADGSPKSRAPGTEDANATAPLPVARWQPFPTVLLPDPAGQIVREAAAAIGCDPAFVGLPLLVALASAIGNSRAIVLKRGWVEPCVLWGAIVGESGDLKSPALDVALKAIRRRQQEAIAAHKEALQGYAEERVRHEAAVKKWHQRSDGDEPPPVEPAKPVCSRYSVDDITVEALADRLSESPRGLLVARDELAGWLTSLNQYKGGKGSDAAHYLAMHGARPLTVDRKTGDKPVIYIPRAAVSIIGGVQPGILRQLLAKEHFEDGMAARLLLAMPPRRVKKWTDAEISEEAERALSELFDRLYTLQPEFDVAGNTSPIILPLTRRAKEVWIQFYNVHAIELAARSGDLAAAWSKLEGYAARLALVVQLIKDPESRAVDKASVESGIALSRWFGGEAERVYGVLGETEEETERRNLSELISRRGGRITVPELMHACRKYRASSDDARGALQKLVDAERGRWEFSSPGPKGGAPATVFVLNGNSTSQEAENSEVPLPPHPRDMDTDNAADIPPGHEEI